MFSTASVDPPSSPGGVGTSSPTALLRQGLDLEHNENQQLERQLRDSRKKLSTAIQVQSQLELDVVDLAKQVSVLQGQVKELRKSKHSLESDLSQEQMTYMNEKQQWLDKEAASDKSVLLLKEEVAKLKQALGQQQKEAEPTPPTPTGFSFPLFGRSKDTSDAGSTAASTTTSGSTNSTKGHSRLLSIGGGSSQANTIAGKDKVIERLKNELDLVQQQTEMVAREYSHRHEKIETELVQTKTLVSRLMEENEGFQVLVAEKAILGGFAPDESESLVHNGSNSLADELNRAGAHNQSSENLDNECINDNDDSNENKNNDAMAAKEADGSLKKRMYELEFESKSLKNHNKALTTSLERLVQRLLEFREFERVLETQGMSGNINTKSIGTFHNRMGNGIGIGNGGNGNRTSNLAGRQPGDRSSVMSDMGYSFGGGLGGGGGRRGHSKNKDSISSIFSMPANGSGLGHRSRNIKNPATWTSMMFGAGGLTPPANTSGGVGDAGTALPVSTANLQASTNSNNSEHDACFDSTSASSTASMSSPPPLRPVSPSASESTVISNSVAVVSSSSSSISSTPEEQAQIAAILEADFARRPSTNGQKKLRPLAMGV